MSTPGPSPTAARADSSGPEDLGVVTGEAVAIDVRPTSFALRAAGAIIDLIAEAVLFVLLLVAVVRLATDAALVQALTIIALVVAFILAPTIVETATRGRSLGRLAVGARIVRDDGGAIGLRHAFIRSLVGVIELVISFGGVAALVGLANRRSKRLGDLLAGTVSQHERVPSPPVVTRGVPVPLMAWAVNADVGRLPDRLGRRIGSFLAQAPKLAPASRARLAASLAAEAAPFIAPLPDTEPELLLAAVAAIRRDRELRALTLAQDRATRLAARLTTNPHGFPDR